MDIYLEKCKKYHFEYYYELKCDEENIYWTGHKYKPDKVKLKEWFKKQLKRKDRILFLVKSNEVPDEAVGYLYLDIVGEKNNIVEIGHAVNSKFKGQGNGTKIIRFASDYSRNELPFIDRVDGWIVHNNIGSIKTFLKNGYSETHYTKNFFFESLNKEVTMKRYSYKIKR